ncbi:MAG TPA: RtcB family protein [Armatimonadota bacterium]|nr:RtcB family protein [Planctomycetota bacterium]HUV04072.1 RtcB family protein [Armatimonadota bacterium]
METTSAACAHGAGRTNSRNASAREVDAADVARDLAARGIIVRAKGRRTLVAEISEAYNDVTDVVDIVHNSGIARKVTRLVPLAVMKG